jgi:peptidoglycan/LPS O-acetylase OafA/YrhL
MAAVKRALLLSTGDRFFGPVTNFETGLSRPAEGYFPAIDGLRAIAVLAVLFYHLNGLYLPGGFAGVDIFFVISGFVVTLSVKDRDFRTIPDLLSFFYARRILRIAPALIAVLLFFAIVTNLFIPNAWLSDTNRKTALWAFLGASNIWLAGGGNAYFDPRADFNPFTHTWSLGVEEQFYLLFPFLMGFTVVKGLRRFRSSTFWLTVALSLASLLVCAQTTRSHQQFAFYQIPSRFWELGVGMALALSMSSWRASIASLPRSAVEGIGFIGVAAVVASLLLTDASGFPFPWALSAVIGTAAMIAVVAVRSDTALTTVLASRPPTFIGRISYSLYLWHWPVFVLARWTVGLDDPRVRLAAVAVAVIFAIASYKFIERPFRGSKAIRALPRRIVVTGGVIAIIAATALTRTVFEAREQMSLSVTSDEQVWRPDLLPSASGECRVSRSDRSLRAGYVTTIRRENCGDTAVQRLLVPGDSHALAYIGMLGRLVQDRPFEVSLYADPGCSFMNMMKSRSKMSGTCNRFVDAVIEEITLSIKPSDVVFLPGLRVARFRDQWGGPETSIHPGGDIDEVAVRELANFAASISALGGRVILEAPKPIFRSAPFRCSDWFNRLNPACKPGFEVPREELQERRRNVFDAETDLARSTNNVAVWDPFPILCPSNTCSAYRDGKPMFFDGDHLSGFGNAVLYANFRDQLLGSTLQAAK